jgi:hypothetical protein
VSGVQVPVPPPQSTFSKKKMIRARGLLRAISASVTP